MLRGLAASLTVHFPWGSLLRGVLGNNDAALAGIARLLAPGAEATVLVSVLPRDNAPAVPAADALAAAYEHHGLSLVDAREATPAEVAASHSSWAKRLRAGAERAVTLLRVRAVGAEQAAAEHRRATSTHAADSTRLAKAQGNT